LHYDVDLSFQVLLVLNRLEIAFAFDDIKKYLLEGVSKVLIESIVDPGIDHARDVTEPCEHVD
jgi:hypothetical protein